MVTKWDSMVGGLRINRQVHSPFELPKRRSFHLRSMTCLSLHLTRSAFPLFGLIRIGRIALYTLLRSSVTYSIRSVPANTQTASVVTVQ